MSKFNIGDKVIFIGFNNDELDGPNAWKLERFKIYTIDNKAFETHKDTGTFYAVTDDKGTHTSWYKEKDFISNTELRKEKLEKIRKINEQNIYNK